MFSGKIFQFRLMQSFVRSPALFHGINERSLIGLYRLKYEFPNSENSRYITSIDEACTFSSSATNVNSDNSSTHDLNYNDILKAQKKDVLIIDVREQDEINETGKLPGSIHIPMGNVSQYLTTLSDEEFHNKFGRKKPNKDSKIILSCRSGKRSGMVQEEIQKLGYDNVYNYVGGWLDWENKQKS